MLRARVNIAGAAQGGGVSTFYFGGDDSAPVATDVADALYAFYDALKVDIHFQTTFTIDSVMDVVTASNGQVTAARTVTPWTVTGAQTDPPLPWGTQVLVQWRTGFYNDGSELRGRTFIPGYCTSAVSSGQVASAKQSTVNTAAANLIADGDSSLLVYRREREAGSGVNGDLGHRDGVSADVITGTCWTKFANLRSRRD